MERNQQHSSCPIANTAKIIGDLWIILIIRELINGPKRFNELQIQVSDIDLNSKISTKTLTQRLKYLESEHIIKRVVTAPTHIEYSLTTKGRDLIGIIDLIRNYGEKHIVNISKS